MAMLLAVVWLPMVSHCAWEHLPGFEALGCCTGEDHVPHENDDCQTDLCASVESGHYKVEEQSIQVPAPALLAVFLAPLVSAEPGEFVRQCASSAPVAPELPQRWQFLSRTAAPPRAPSLVS